MANTVPALVSGTQWKSVDLDTTTTDLVLGATTARTLGAFVLQVVDLGSWNGSITLQVRAPTSASLSNAFVSVAYENLATGAEVAAGTAITAAGIYKVPVDFGLELGIDYTHTAGSVRVIFRPGVG